MTLVGGLRTNVMLNVIWLKIRVYDIYDITLSKLHKINKYILFNRFLANSGSNVICHIFYLWISIFQLVWAVIIYSCQKQ